MDLFTYPEGWNEMLEQMELDFLPDDQDEKEEYLKSYLSFLWIL